VIIVGLILLTAGIGVLLAMVIHVLPASLWISLAGYAATITGVFLAGLQIAARYRP
jgi:hypothetical protein